jgi:hypothetical protein
MEEEKKEESPVVLAKKRGKGRPPKSDIEAVKNKNKGKLGRPAGDASRIQEFKARLLATGGNRIIDKMVSIAMTDGHPGQMAAIKLAVDRLLPISLFEEAKQGGGIPQISINIQGLTAPVVEAVEDVTDVEVKGL